MSQARHPGNWAVAWSPTSATSQYQITKGSSARNAPVAAPRAAGLARRKSGHSCTSGASDVSTASVR